MSMKRILVTGGNKGIGKAICERLLGEWKDTYVILGSRSAERGQQACDDILKSMPEAKGRISMLELDTTSDESVEKAAETLQSLCDSPLFAICNNAGVGWGYSMKDTVNTNYFGPRRVNSVIGPLIQKGGRIVNVASASGPNFVSDCTDSVLVDKLSKPWTIHGGLKELDDMAHKMQGDNAYGASKALLNAYTVLHGKAQKDVIVNSCTPGFILTDLTAGTTASNPPSKGAVPVCWLLMDPSIDKIPAGRYFGSDCVRSPIDVYRGPGAAPYESDEDLVDLPRSVLVI